MRNAESFNVDCAEGEFARVGEEVRGVASESGAVAVEREDISVDDFGSLSNETSGGSKCDAAPCGAAGDLSDIRFSS